MTPARRRPAGPVAVLLAVGGVLLVAAVVLGVLDARASARTADRQDAMAAARAHLADLGAAGTDPAARDRALGGATGTWRDRVAATPAGRPTTTVVRSAGLESLEGDDARVLAVGLVAGGTVPRPFRAAVALVRADDRWLVADVSEVA
ncbi:hypothetical protein [Actinomycetospora termitidis]|uniref:Mce-associated membrane protein n=1 Tax=Actinomycetospora termitidis TaxID=3053470 RepID=A0ABT7MBZ7_9PSEU|nr:hypothetical protein [Actinomycetospora sp. Odt1-22]MDL5158195.1 hypothetical protein [Actinomycetospora sp. Odt1-22]